MNKESIISLIKEIKYAMITTQSNGLMARPMYTADVSQDGEIFFFTVFDTNKVNQFLDNPNVLVTYANHSNQEYISAQGHASVSFDKVKMKKHWATLNEPFFTEGIETEGLCLIIVKMSHVECWNSDQNIFEKAWNFAKGFKEGEVADLGQQESLTFQ